MALLVVVLAAPATAPAKIQVDPDAPAGVQYSAPLDRAREEGSGRGGNAGAPGSSEQAPLFGEGVEREKASGAPGSSSGEGDHDGSSVSAGDTRSAALGVAGITIAVIAIGGSLAFLINWRPRPGPG